MIAQAQSGTGKTATFSIAVLQNTSAELLETQALILAPTRELATQIHNVISAIGLHMNLSINCFIGGQSAGGYESRNWFKSQIIVGTPGKIYDMIQRGMIQLGNLRNLVLDEADEMLSRSFIEQIQSIFKCIPSDTKVGIYSATLPPEALRITQKFMNNPIRILLKRESLTLEGIKQYYIDVVNESYKYDTLKDLYSSMAIYQMIIYCNTKKSVDILSTRLENEGFTVSAIHGQMDASTRNDIMLKFRKGENRVLISTDLLCRGIDIQQVSLVINYEIPRQVESYLHRIGRSGRYGRKGYAINFLSKNEYKSLGDIEKFYQTQIIEMPQDISSALNI